MANSSIPPEVPQLTLPVPQRSDPLHFRPRADTLLTELPFVVSGINAAIAYVESAKMDVASMEGIRDDATQAKNNAQQSEHNVQVIVQNASDLIDALNDELGLPEPGIIGSALVQSEVGLAFTEYTMGKQAFAHAIPYRELDSNGLAQTYQVIGVNTEDAVCTITLPANPRVGDWVRFYDSHAAWSRNNPVIARNGRKIMGLEEDMVVNVKGQNFTLTYISGERGWVIT